MQHELLTLRSDAAAASHERRQLQQHVSTLQHERSEQGRVMSELQQQLGDLREQQRQDRATLATMLRQHQEREAQLQEVGAETATDWWCSASSHPRNMKHSAVRITFVKDCAHAQQHWSSIWDLRTTAAGMMLCSVLRLMVLPNPHALHSFTVHTALP